MTAKGFCGLNENVPKGLERVLFRITIDQDFTNDTGKYIMLMSAAPLEDEWLLGPGAEFEIGEIKPEIMSRSKDKKLEIDEEKDVQNYLEKKS